MEPRWTGGLTEPKRLLEEAGAQTDVIAPGDASEIKDWSDGDWGSTVAVDVPLADARAERYDALMLAGGVMNPEKLRLVPAVVELVKAFGAAAKPIAAICHGPWTLIEAGLVRNRRMTSWPSLRTDLQNAGAQWQDSEVVRDGPLITSRRPGDIPAFANAIIEALDAAPAHAGSSQASS